MTHWVVEVQVLSSALRIGLFEPARARSRRCPPCSVAKAVREACAAAVDAALGAGAAYADARAVRAPLAVGRDEERPRRHAHRRRDRGDRRPRARRRRLGLRLRPPADARGRARRGAPRLRLRRRGRRRNGSRALAPLEARSGSYRHAVQQRPVRVSLDDKVALCLRAEEAMKHADVKVAQAVVRAQRERKLFLSSDGAEIEQELVECGGGIDAIAVARRARPDAQLPERARRLERAGRLGVRRERSASSREGAAGRRGGGSAAPRRRVPGRR